MTNFNTEIAELKAIKATLPRKSDGRVQYTNTFRRRVVDLIDNRPKDMTQSYILDTLNIGQPLVFRWKRDASRHGYVPEVAVAASRMQRGVSAVSALSNKRDELMLELTKVDQAIALLKELGL